MSIVGVTNTDLAVVLQQRDVVSDAHDAGEGHGSLVEGLQEVGEDHDGQDPPVYHPLEPLALLWRNLDGDGVDILCQLCIHTLVVHVVTLLVRGRHDALDFGDISLPRIMSRVVHDFWARAHSILVGVRHVRWRVPQTIPQRA